MAENLEEFLISVENPRFKGRGKGTGRFHSFKVERDDGVEEWNVGFGHKIPAQKASVMVGGREIHVGPGSPGLTEAQARQLLREDIAKARKKAAREFNQFNPLEDGTRFDQLRDVERDLMTEIVFNVGTLNKTKDRQKVEGVFGWPKLARAMWEYRSGNKDRLDTILAETERKGLTDRNQKLKEYFGSRWTPSTDVNLSELMKQSAKRVEAGSSPDLLSLFQQSQRRLEDAKQGEGVQDARQESKEEGSQEEVDDKPMRLEPGVYERPDGSLFEVSFGNEVREVGPSKTSQ